MFEWCQKLQKHLDNFEWERVPNDEIKKMLLTCIKRSARQEIVLLQPDGLAIDNYEIGEFLHQELLRSLHMRRMKKALKRSSTRVRLRMSWVIN